MSNNAAYRERRRLRRNRKRKQARQLGGFSSSGPSIGLAQLIAYFNRRDRRPLYATPAPREEIAV